MDLSALERSVINLEKSLDSLEGWLAFMTALVVLGLVLEYWYEIPEAIEALRKAWSWKPVCIIVGSVLITVGVAGELFVQFRASTVDTKIRSANHEIEAILSKGAAEANKEAGLARAEAAASNLIAKGFESKIADSNARAKAAEAQVASAKAASLDAVAKVAAAEARSKEASTKTESFRLDIARANERAAEATAAAERERFARVQIEQRLAPRNLTRASQIQMESALKKFEPRDIDIVLSAGNPEADNLVSQITYVFEQLHWRFYFYTPLGGSLRGIRIEYDGSDKITTDVVAIFVSSLQSSGLVATVIPSLPPIMQELGAYTSSNGATGSAKVRLFVGAK